VALHVTAVLDRATVSELLSELMPLTIPLDDEEPHRRLIEVERPSLVEFVPDVGLRVRTKAKVTWTLAGMSLPWVLHSITLLARPVITGGKKDRLDFDIRVVEADLQHVPDLLDEGIVAVVNQRLATFEGKVGWTFGETLDLRVGLPALLRPVESFSLGAEAGAVTVAEEGLRLSFELALRFDRAGKERDT
jgi:hypothetical protein